MARGFFRTSRSICLYCGKSASEGVEIFKRGKKNQPDYLCERCFDRSATDEEKENKNELHVNKQIRITGSPNDTVWYSKYIGKKYDALEFSECGKVRVKRGNGKRPYWVEKDHYTMV